MTEEAVLDDEEDDDEVEDEDELVVVPLHDVVNSVVLEVVVTGMVMTTCTGVLTTCSIENSILWCLSLACSAYVG